MADFSKQYCLKQNDGQLGDFDIIEEFNRLEEDYSVSFICEGFGFVAIGKEKNSPNPKLLFNIQIAVQEGYWNKSIPKGLDKEDYVWIDYDQLK